MAAELSGFIGECLHTRELSDEGILRVARTLWAGLDTPRSLTCAMLLDAGEYAQLVGLAFRPGDYLDSELVAQWIGVPSFSRARDDYQATKLLAKWPNFVHPDLDPVGSCINADNEAENACLASNRRIRDWLMNSIDHRGDYKWLNLFHMMQDDIRQVLGTFCPTAWGTASRFGPGKAQAQSGLIDYEKLVGNPSCTAEFMPLGLTLLAESTAWLDALDPTHTPDPFGPASAAVIGDSEDVWNFSVTEVQGDIPSMVPKNAKTRRGIKSQPGLNVFAQLGLGRLMRESLKAVGLDLSDQSANQDLARRGSMPGSKIVTLDLKGASGHICYALVDALFSGPGMDPGWLYAMNKSRTWLIQNQPEAAPQSLSSYSAMGNGFTFELETLIFWSAVRACRRLVGCHGPYRVYGDDIICTREVAGVLIPFLLHLGFPLNPAKSFVSGPFRESCGGDYWNGTNITPVYLSLGSDEMEKENADRIQVLRWVQIANALRRKAHRDNHGLGCDHRYAAAWRHAVSGITPLVRAAITGPWLNDGDLHLIEAEDVVALNPLVHKSRKLQTLVKPTFYCLPRMSITPGDFAGVKATLLWRLKEGGVVAYAPSWRRMRSILKNTQTVTESNMDRTFRSLGLRPPVVSKGVSLPSSSFALGAGWEAFQPELTDVAWR